MAYRYKTSKRSAAGRVAVIGVMLFWVALGIFPLYWAVVTSLKPSVSVAEIPPQLLPDSLSTQNWKDLFASPGAIRWTINSVVVSSIVAVGTTVTSLLAGFAFAHGKFAGRKVLFAVVIAMLMFSSQVLMVPQFIVMRDLGLLNTYFALILPMIASPFGVFLTKQFLQTIPSEIFDAARIDGCSELSLILRVVAPIARPALTIVGVFSFLTAWNEYLYPLIMVDSNELRTLAVAMSLLEGQFGSNYGVLMAAAVLMALPPLILFLFMQKAFVSGLTVGAVK